MMARNIKQKLGKVGISGNMSECQQRTQTQIMNEIIIIIMIIIWRRNRWRMMMMKKKKKLQAVPPIVVVVVVVVILSDYVSGTTRHDCPSEQIKGWTTRSLWVFGLMQLSLLSQCCCFCFMNIKLIYIYIYVRIYIYILLLSPRWAQRLKMLYSSALCFVCCCSQISLLLLKWSCIFLLSTASSTTAIYFSIKCAKSVNLINLIVAAKEMWLKISTWPRFKAKFVVSQSQVYFCYFLKHF